MPGPEPANSAPGKNIAEYQIDYIPEGEGPAMKISTGNLPELFPKVEATAVQESSAKAHSKSNPQSMM